MRQFIKCAVAMLLFLTLYNVEASAQFYTVNFVSLGADTLSISADPFTGGPLAVAKVDTKSALRNKSKEKSKKNGEKSFSSTKLKTSENQVFNLFNATDSLLLELIRKRLTVCMPLDLMHVNSPYGYRRDPFTKCRKFHDGIDLRAGNDLVYSMLPGKVAEVRHGNSGYGNYVVLDHGRLRCLYGHLGKIMVSEGEIIDAGTAIAVASNSGRATGIHLHLKLSRLVNGEWKSVDPMPFINSLNDYINEYNERLDEIMGRERTHPDAGLPELTIANLYNELKRQGVRHPKIVLAQAILESGHFRSKLTRTHNNIFGIRCRNGNYQMFAHWTESVTAYRDLVQYKYKPNRENYYAFLNRIGYASDRNYIYKVKEIADRL